MNRILTTIILGLLIVQTASAQGVEVKEHIDSLQILIGEQTVLHIDVKAPKGQYVQFPSFKPAQELTPGVEVVQQTDGDTLNMDGGMVAVSRHYTLTSFDENVYAIPALKVKVAGREYHGNQLALKVLTVSVDTLHTDKFFPPKDVQKNPFLWSEWSIIFWLSLLMIVVCVAIAYLYIRLKQHKPIITRIRIVKRIPPHEQAMQEINSIKQQHAHEQGNQKEYYTQLTGTLRQYIASRFSFNAMEMTSAEIIARLQTAGDQQMIDELKVLFRTADLVKFAKYETLINENDANLLGAIHFIDQTKTDEVQHEEVVKPQLTESDIKTRQHRRLVKILLTLGSLLAVALLVYIVYSITLLII